MAQLPKVDGRLPTTTQDWIMRCESLAWCELPFGRNVLLLRCFGRPLPTCRGWSTRAHFYLLLKNKHREKCSSFKSSNLPSFCSNFKSLSLEIFRSSGLLSSWSKIAEFNNACSWSGSYSKALSRYANACAGLFSSKKTTPSCLMRKYVRVVRLSTYHLHEIKKKIIRNGERNEKLVRFSPRKQKYLSGRGRERKKSFLMLKFFAISVSLPLHKTFSFAFKVNRLLLRVMNRCLFLVIVSREILKWNLLHNSISRLQSIFEMIKEGNFKV